MSRPAKPPSCPLCHTVLGVNEPVYSTVTTETYKVRKWVGGMNIIETGETGTRRLRWYACEACARKEHPDYFPTAESLKLPRDKLSANPEDWDAYWKYKRALEGYREHRRCVRCNRPIREKGDSLS